MDHPQDNMSLRVASFACYLDTAKDSIAHKVSSQDTNNLSKRSLNDDSTIIKPPFSIKFSNPRENGGHVHERALTNLRVDSFSNYLHATDDEYNNNNNNNFVFEVPGPVKDPTSAFTFFSQDLPKDGSGEISIFGADKYFNMKLDNKQTDAVLKPLRHKPSDLPRPNVKPPNSPSLKSEASSLNSQSALIKDARNKGPQVKQRKAFGRKIFTGFGCKGPCFAKKSIHVNETTSTRSVPNAGTVPGKELHPVQINLDESRHSIEVFGSRGTATKSKRGSDIAANMERKLSMLTWDAIPKYQNHPTNSTVTCDDMASEASSDLFEIDNISGSMYHLLANSDHPPSSGNGVSSSCIMSPASQYAPSEASIQWSIVTASAAPADFSSALSDMEASTGIHITAAPDDVVQMNNNLMNGVVSSTSCKIIAGKEPQRIMNRPGGLLGCKNNKSVDVVENDCEKQGHERTRNFHEQGLDLSLPFGKSLAACKGRLMKMDHIHTRHLPMKSHHSQHL